MYIQFWIGLINNMDHMRISGTEPWLENVFFGKGNNHKSLKLNKISKIVFDFCIKTSLRCGIFNLYFRYIIRECQFHKRSALTISKFYCMITPKLF